MIPKQENTKEVMLLLVIVSIGGYFYTHHIFCLYLGFGLGLIGLFVPFLSNFITWVWLKFGAILGMINTKIILSALFFLVLVPIALLRRFFSKKDTIVNAVPTQSMFITKNLTYQKKDLEKMW